MRFSTRYLSNTFVDAKNNGERIVNIMYMFMKRKRHDD
jgi:hypothetical protein